MKQLTIYVQLTNLQGQRFDTKIAIERAEQDDVFDLSNVHSMFAVEAISIAASEHNLRPSQVTHSRILAA